MRKMNVALDTIVLNKMNTENEKMYFRGKIGDPDKPKTNRTKTGNTYYSNG